MPTRYDIPEHRKAFPPAGMDKVDLGFYTHSVRIILQELVVLDGPDLQSWKSP